MWQKNYVVLLVYGEKKRYKRNGVQPSTVYTIHKKDGKQICNNFKGIALFNVTYKILSYYILDRIKPLKEGILRDYQPSFMQNCSTLGQIFILCQVL